MVLVRVILAWGVGVLLYLCLEDDPVHLNGGSNNTTNNQMELTATIEGLKYFKESEQYFNFY